MKKYLQALVNFWFLPVDSRCYSLVRVCYAVAAIVNLSVLFPHRSSFFGSSGMVVQKHFSLATPSILFLTQEASEITMLFALVCMAMLSLLIGFHSRVALAICCLWHVSVHVALGPMSSGFDSVLRIYGFILLISPMPGGIKESIRGRERPVVPAYGIRLMQLQLCAIYWCTVLPKWLNETWRSGEYLWYFLNSSFSSVPHAFTVEYALLLKYGTWGTLVFESTIPLILLCGKTRRLGLFLGFLFHAGIALLSSLYLFSVAMIPAYASFFCCSDFTKRRFLPGGDS